MKPHFRQCALASELVTQADLDAAVAELRAAGGVTTEAAITDRQLADKLMEMGRLNIYQTTQLLAGLWSLKLGPYCILDEIGRGGMGEVYKAEHEIMGRIVALKVLPKIKSTPAAIASFRREIRAQAKLDHKHLVRAFDAGHDRGVYFLATEFVPGMDLRKYVRARGPLGMREAATIISQAADGLQHAHQMGLVHRDVKPGNLLVTPEGHTKVSDLGLAGWLTEDGPEFLSGKIVGTADYLPPEQVVTPGVVTPLGDIYSLGCTLYYAVTGKVPYPGGTTAEKAHRHCNDTPITPRRFNATLSEEFIEAISEMMNKDPQQRIRSAADVVQRLAPWAGEHVTGADEPVDAAVAPAQSSLTPPPFDQVADGPGDYSDFAELLAGDVGHSQVSQGTDPVASGDQDTLPDGVMRKPLVAGTRLWRRLVDRLYDTSILVWALIILMPVAVGLIAWLLVSILRGL
jgi:eukaryotic-like serine/threonine-protein kinase